MGSIVRRSFNGGHWQRRALGSGPLSCDLRDLRQAMAHAVRAAQAVGQRAVKYGAGVRGIAGGVAPQHHLAELASVPRIAPRPVGQGGYRGG
jgi:hypothetical protein